MNISVVMPANQLRLVRAALGLWQSKMHGLQKPQDEEAVALATQHGAFLDPLEIDALIERLSAKTGARETDDMDELTPEMQAKYLEAAHDYAGDDISFDDPDAVAYSPSKDGCWVSAWVWVDKDEVGIEETCECGRAEHLCSFANTGEHGDVDDAESEVAEATASA